MSNPSACQLSLKQSGPNGNQEGCHKLKKEKKKKWRPFTQMTQIIWYGKLPNLPAMETNTELPIWYSSLEEPVTRRMVNFFEQCLSRQGRVICPRIIPLWGDRFPFLRQLWSVKRKDFIKCYINTKATPYSLASYSQTSITLMHVPGTQ